MATFIARLNRNFRNVNRSDVKVLLTSIHNETTNEEFRDHCWIPVSKKIAKMIPTTNRTSVVIRFTANIEAYAHDASKQMLTNIKNIELAGA